MSAPFRRYDPEQILLLPHDLQQWLPPGHLARFAMDVVRELNLREIYAYYDLAPMTNEAGEVTGVRVKSNRGMPAYDPCMMTTLLLYGYVVGVVSSRQIERKCHEDVAFRVIAANQAPDHNTIAEFRRIHLQALRRLFVQVLALCRKAGLVKLGHVALDGTKVKANASKHKAMSYGYMKKAEKELESQIQELLQRAEETDMEEDRQYGKGKRGDELPDELVRRETRLAKIREAKAALEAEAKARAEEIRRADEEERKRRERDGGPAKPGKKPDPPDLPDEKAQRNFTDPESKIMPGADKGFLQGYNAQAAVDHANQVIVACDLTDEAVDVHQVEPMLDQVKENTGAQPHAVSADAGYFSEDNVRSLESRGIDPLIAAERLKHTEKPPAARGRIPKNLSVKERMRRKLRTLAGRLSYALRKITVEPVFGQIRTWTPAVLDAGAGEGACGMGDLVHGPQSSEAVSVGRVRGPGGVVGVWGAAAVPKRPLARWCGKLSAKDQGSGIENSLCFKIFHLRFRSACVP